MSARTTWRSGLSAEEIRARLQERRERDRQAKLAKETERRAGRKELIHAFVHVLAVVLIAWVVVTIGQRLFEMLSAWIKG